MLESARRERPSENLVGYVETARFVGGVARRDRATERPENGFELATAEGSRVPTDPERGHAAPEIAAKGAWYDRALGREHASHGDAVGDQGAQVLARHLGGGAVEVRPLSAGW